MSRVIGVVGVQVAPRAYDVEATFDKFARETSRLAGSFPGFDLYVFPELYLSALGSFGDDPPSGYVARVAETIPGPLTDRIGTVARSVGKWIVAGSIYERHGDAVHNTAIVLSPSGDLVASYRKLFPWMPYEPTTPGDRYVTFDIPRRRSVRAGHLLRRLGARDPAHARLAGRRGHRPAHGDDGPSIGSRSSSSRALTPSPIRSSWSTPTTAPNSGPGGRSSSTRRVGCSRLGGSGEEFLTQMIDLDSP